MKAHNIFLPQGATSSSKILIDGCELKVVHDGVEARVPLNENFEVLATWGSLASYGLLNQEGEFSSRLQSGDIVAECRLSGGMGFRIMGDGRFFGRGMTHVNTKPLFLGTWPPICD